MFEQLQQSLRRTFDRLRGRGRLGPDDIRQALREVRIALLDADVHFQVAKDFVSRLEPRLLGQEVMQSLTPGQTAIREVQQQLQDLLGGETAPLRLRGKEPHVILLLGLQGAGKTTFAAKLALRLKGEQHWPLLVACDLKRPAAIEQLATLAARIAVPVALPDRLTDPADVVRDAVRRAGREGNDVVIVDTAGRQTVDEELMEELCRIRDAAPPAASILVIDAMTGQAALPVAEAFQGRIGIDGVALSKLDGDARGGAALTVRAVTGKPILFASLGEAPEQLEPFHPDRMAQRILGMGDVRTLIERAQSEVGEQQARDLGERMRRGEFGLEDFLEQLRAVQRMGPIRDLIGMIPGLSRKVKDQDIDERQLVRTRAIIESMTRHERRDPRILDASRRRRIARGSGTSVADVNRMLKQFEEMRRMTKSMRNMRGRLPPMPPIEGR